jgi:hypothetical protein
MQAGYAMGSPACDHTGKLNRVNYHHLRWWLDKKYLEGTLFLKLVIPET